MQKVFVYGTLKKGYHNHYGLADCPMKKAEVVGYDLHASAYLPFVKEGSGIVKGELYEVSEQILLRLDQLEGHPDFYQRVMTEVTTANQKVNAWIYLCRDAARYPLVASGEWQGR